MDRMNRKDRMGRTNRIALLATSAVAGLCLFGFADDKKPVPAPAPASKSDPKATTPKTPPADTKPKDDDTGAKAADEPLVTFKDRVRIETEKLDHEYDAGFFEYFYDDGIVPRPYLLASEKKPSLDPEVVKLEYAETLGALYKFFMAEYGSLLGITDVEHPLVVLVFDSVDSFNAVRKKKPGLGLPDPAIMAGFYSPGNRRLHQWRGGQDMQILNVLFHEGCHQLEDWAAATHQQALFSMSPWLMEGMAEYANGYKVDRKYSETAKRFVRNFTLGQFVDGRYRQLQDVMQNPEVRLSLKRMVQMGAPEFFGLQQAAYVNPAAAQTFGAVYAEGWALVKFLNQFDNGHYQGQFRSFLKAEMTGEGGPEKFAKLLVIDNDDDWAALDEDFSNYVYGDLRNEKKKK